MMSLPVLFATGVAFEVITFVILFLSCVTILLVFFFLIIFL
jgi:hypothetical protein